MKNTDEKKQKRVCAPNDAAPYFFHQGTSTRAYEYLGAHREGNRYVFRVWAPNADYVSVCGDFTDWRHDIFPLARVTDRGVWECVIEATQIKEGQKYKYYIRNGCREIYKADPYGTQMETPPGTASLISDINGYRWRDAGWSRYRKGHFSREAVQGQPINVYELHAGSWKRHDDGRLYSYADLAADLVTYVKQMGYTHVELMPLAEYSDDSSWGYRVTGYYAVTSRYGGPKELMAFVDTMHEAGIGVILDWVPAFFPKDAHGLCEFDGRPLYEYKDPKRMEHPLWGTRCFDLGCEEVQSFLLSNAYFWIEKFHVDGLRVDALASMLCPDCDRTDGEWTPQIYGGKENLETVAFFRKLNASLARDYPDVMTVAEMSAACSNVTSFSDGGLGFTLKWNTGWMNNALSYLSEDPLFRKHRHDQMYFSVADPYDGHDVLPISHDAVVHGKKSLLGRSAGEYEQKFAGERAFLTYMMTHPGKKLMFMGCELGQFREWDFAEQIDWFLLKYDMHAAMQLFAAELNHFYLEQPALWQRDGDPSGFAWIDPDDRDQSIYSYRRRDEKNKELIVLLNFTPVRRDGFLLAVPEEGIYEEVFNSDEERFGGTGCLNTGQLHTESYGPGGYDSAIRINVPPMSGVIWKCVRRVTKHKKQV